MQKSQLYIYVFLCLYKSIVHCGTDGFIVYKPLNQINIQQASRELTTYESETIKRYLDERADIAKQLTAIDPNNREFSLLEEIIKNFNFGRYDLVIQGLYD